MNTEFSLDDWVRHVHSLPYFERRLEIAQRVNPPLSRFLYKYRPLGSSEDVEIDRVRDILVRGRLWLSAPTDFNDPFDMSAKVVAAGSALQRRKRMNSLLKAHGLSRAERKTRLRALLNTPLSELEEKLSSVYDQNIEGVGVFSFAGDPRSILMWSHYARDHTGVCIRFERARDFLTLSNALPVEYSSEYPMLNWISEFASSLGKVVLRKHDGWQYEKEERIVRLGESRKYLTFKPEAITGVILGCNAADETKEQVSSLIQERVSAGFRAPMIYMASKHESRYQLIIRRVALR